MNYQDKLEYARKYRFGLKDYNKTYNKYVNYKGKEYNEVIKSFWEIFHNRREYQIELDYYIWCKFQDRNNYIEWKLDTKTEIRSLATYINYWAREFNEKELEYVLESNDILYNPNMLHNFTIKFYLDNYQLVNWQMRDCLVQIVASWKSH